MIEKIKSDFRGKELSIDTGEGTVAVQDLIFEWIIRGNKREEEEYRYKKKRYSFLHNSLHGRIIRRKNFRVKIIFVRLQVKAPLAQREEKLRVLLRVVFSQPDP
jgi:hypothetical protein